MGLDVQCPQCGQRLEVEEQYAGHTVACPICRATFAAPTPATAAGGKGEESEDPPLWSLKTPEGRTYGPVTKTTLDRWVSEGRVADDCELQGGPNEPWRTADRVYAVLRPDAASAPRRGNPFAAAPFYYSQAAPIAQGTAVGGASPHQYQNPHRGGLVLALGILGFPLAFCPVLSFLAWTMGANDLREMREGRMDPAGMRMTQAGMVLGMALSAFAIVVILGLVFYLLLASFF